LAGIFPQVQRLVSWEAAISARQGRPGGEVTIVPHGPLLPLLLMLLLWVAGGNASARPLVDQWESGLVGCPISVSDQYFYRRMIALQDAGQWQAAQRMRRWIDNDLLLGWISARRILGEDRVFSYDLLEAWLKRYADHPDAEAIYKLAEKRKPADGPAPNEPVRAKQRLENQPPLFPRYFYRSDKTLSQSQYQRLLQLKRILNDKLGGYRLTEVEQLLGSREVLELFDDYELNQIKAGLAAGRFYRNNNEGAFELAREVALADGQRLPLAHWTAGLAGWRLNHLGEAAEHFAQLSEADKASP
jgi:hypothetical protein